MTDTTIEIDDGVHVAELQPLTLTILAHPRLERLGQQCALYGRGPFSVSRSEPSFGDPGLDAEALADPHVSRKAVLIHVEYGSVSFTSENTKARLDGAPLGSVAKTVDTEALARGVILSLGNYVAVLVRRAEPGQVFEDLAMVGPSPELRDLRERVRRLARGKQAVLVNGETGTGKELVAEAVHGQSPRADGPWVSVNLAAIPASTAASQLFGHVRGAFTGAKASSVGLFGAADGGTLFLDELGEAPIEIQPLLLRALESGEVQVVGGGTRHVDVRVVAATDAQLDEAVAAGRLRPALYHRLAGATIVLTPLRDRREDIAAQLRHFVVGQLGELGQLAKLADTKWFGPRHQLALVCHDWPGNTRQLRRVLEAMILDSLELPEVRLPRLVKRAAEPPGAAGTSSDKPAGGGSSAPAAAPELSEAEALAQALAAKGYRLKPTAETLGVAVNTLKAMMKRHGFRRAKDLDASDIAAARELVGDDIEALSAQLRVSAHALRLRIRELA